MLETDKKIIEKNSHYNNSNQQYDPASREAIIEEFDKTGTLRQLQEFDKEEEKSAKKKNCSNCSISS